MLAPPVFHGTPLMASEQDGLCWSQQADSITLEHTHHALYAVFLCVNTNFKVPPKQRTLLLICAAYGLAPVCTCHAVAVMSSTTSTRSAWQQAPA